MDENGWPLEVGDSETKTLFGNRILEEGEVLLDIYNNRPVRKVDPKWITQCDLLDIATWVYCQYDARRDDLRDGRYHKYSLSIMEYLMSELKPLDLDIFSRSPEFEKDIDLKERHGKVRVKLNFTIQEIYKMALI